MHTIRLKIGMFLLLLPINALALVNPLSKAAEFMSDNGHAIGRIALAISQRKELYKPWAVAAETNPARFDRVKSGLRTGFYAGQILYDASSIAENCGLTFVSNKLNRLLFKSPINRFLQVFAFLEEMNGGVDSDQSQEIRLVHKVNAGMFLGQTMVRPIHHKSKK